MLDYSASTIKIISVTTLIRDFRAVTEELPFLEKIVLTKGGFPFSTLKASREEKKKIRDRYVGSWKGTELDSDEFWEKALKRRSRKNFPKL